MANTRDVSKTAQQGERRQATVMFADISGFTAMSEKLDAEEVTGIMNDCFKLLGGVINDNGGTIDKFIGDCIMSVFGVPKAIEHAPRRAVTAALEMRERLKAFNADRSLSIPLDIHIGINSGEVLAGEVGTGEKNEYTVMGDTVNLASRLEDASETGQILVGPMTFRYARTEFRFNPLKPITVKGKAGAVQVYEVLNAVSTSASDDGPGNSDRMIQSELIGRENERNLLELQIMKLINGEGSVVNLIGEAGVGKSRLSAEVFAAPFIDRVTLLEGRALSTGRNLSYYPIIGIIRNWVSIVDEDRDEQALAKVEAAVRTVAPDTADEIVPFIGTLMGLPLKGVYAERMKDVSEESLTKLISRHLRDLIIASSRFKPLLLVIEDLHWADESSLDMLESMIGVAADNPVMFMFNYRPEHTETTEPFHAKLLESHPSLCTDVVLPALTVDESDRLTVNLLQAKGIPRRLTEQIAERSGGNPFFIEEVIRSLIDFGYVRKTATGFVAGEDLENVTVPNSINEVIMARIDRLDEDMRSLLRIASVIGRSFFYRILMEILETTESLDQTLVALKQMQFIRERMRMEEIEYLFKHALAQEAVYNSLLIKERRRLHLAVAHAIEKLFPDRLQDFYGILAMHFLQGEDFDSAEVYLEKAGQAALNSAASSEALNFFQRALSIYKEKIGSRISAEKIVMLEKNIARAFHIKGLYGEAIKHYDMALAYLGRKNKGKFFDLIEAMFGVLSLLIFIYFPFLRSKKDPDEYMKNKINIMYGKCWAVSLVDAYEFIIYSLIGIRYILKTSVFHIPLGKEMLCAMSQFISSSGISFKIAGRIIETVKPEIREDLDRHLVQNAEQWLEFFSGAGDCVYEDATVDLFVRKGLFSQVNLYLGYWGSRFSFKGHFSGACTAAERAREIGKNYNNESSLVIYYEILSTLSYYQYKQTEGLDAAEKLIQLSQRIGEETLWKLHFSFKLNLLLLAGKIDEAGEIYEKIKNLIEEEKLFIAIQVLIPLNGMAAYLLNRVPLSDSAKEKRGLLLQIQKISGGMKKYGKKYKYQYANVCRLIGTYYWFRGRRRKAFRWWKRGLRQAQALDLQVEIGRISLEVGRRIQEWGHGTSILDKKPAEYFLDAAKTAFDGIGVEGAMEKTVILP